MPKYLFLIALFLAVIVFAVILVRRFIPKKVDLDLDMNNNSRQDYISTGKSGYFNVIEKKNG